MKIAMLAPFEERVPPEKYGGTELVVYNLTQALVRMGHDVVLLASGDSQTNAKLEPVVSRSIRRLKKSQNIETRECLKYIGVGKILDYLRRGDFDIVHNHIGWRMIPFYRFIDFPMVTTLHSPMNEPCEQEVFGGYSQQNYISISYAQRKSLPNINYAANVYNGIEIEKFKFFPDSKEYLMFLGRMSPEKGPLQAIEIAKKTKAKLIMAAKVDAVDGNFFEKKVKPLIDGNQIKFIGEINHKEKADYLGNAKALIAPIQWDEPFGLYFIEAMACGTPVVAFNLGSVSEIIKDKKTGYICKPYDMREMEESIKKIYAMPDLEYGKIRKNCRKHVIKNFSSNKMAREYLEIYNKIIAKKI